MTTPAPSARTAPAPLTVPESSGYAATSSHAQVLDFLDAVERAGDPRVLRTSFGTTPEGRVQPLLVVADPPVAGAAEALACGKPRVLVMANIHAGEVEGKEACLELLRAIVWGPEPYPVDGIVLLLAPIYNADGNDRFGPKNRPLQHGPRLAGTRANAAGKDLNRDYLKQETAEARALLGLLSAWDPHVVVDLHTTNGSAHGYELTYAGPLSPSTEPVLRAAIEEDWLPELRVRVRERWGFELFDYGNFMTADGEEQDEPQPVTGWRSFDHRPRFGNNYVGLRNRVAILSEAYSYADFPVRIAATRAFVTEILRLAAERGEALVALCAQADARTAAEGGAGRLRQAVAVDFKDGGVQELLLRGFEERTDPVTGELCRVASGPRSTLAVPCFVHFTATAERVAPRAYLLPPERAGLAEALSRQGLRVELLAEPFSAEVEVHRVVETTLAAAEFQGHRERQARFDVTLEARTLPAGSLRVGLDQPLARLAFQLLDPQADDGLLVWNVFDDVLARGAGAEVPVYGVR